MYADTWCRFQLFSDVAASHLWFLEIDKEGACRKLQATPDSTQSPPRMVGGSGVLVAFIHRIGGRLRHLYRECGSGRGDSGGGARIRWRADPVAEVLEVGVGVAPAVEAIVGVVAIVVITVIIVEKVAVPEEVAVIVIVVKVVVTASVQLSETTRDPSPTWHRNGRKRKAQAREFLRLVSARDSTVVSREEARVQNNGAPMVPASAMPWARASGVTWQVCKTCGARRIFPEQTRKTRTRPTEAGWINASGTEPPEHQNKTQLLTKFPTRETFYEELTAGPAYQLTRDML